jgi:hypothetical protein
MPFCHQGRSHVSYFVPLFPHSVPPTRAACARPRHTFFPLLKKKTGRTKTIEAAGAFIRLVRKAASLPRLWRLTPASHDHTEATQTLGAPCRLPTLRFDHSSAGCCEPVLKRFHPFQKGATRVALWPLSISTVTPNWQIVGKIYFQIVASFSLTFFFSVLHSFS